MPIKIYYNKSIDYNKSLLYLYPSVYNKDPHIEQFFPEEKNKELNNLNIDLENKIKSKMDISGIINNIEDFYHSVASQKQNCLIYEGYNSEIKRRINIRLDYDAIPEITKYTRKDVIAIARNNGRIEMIPDGKRFRVMNGNKVITNKMVDYSIRNTIKFLDELLKELDKYVHPLNYKNQTKL